MARLHSSLGDRTVYTAAGLAKAQDYAATVYEDPAGTVLANLAAYDSTNPAVPGAAIPGAALQVDAWSNRPAFWDLNDRDVLYISVAGPTGLPGPLEPIRPDAQPQVTALATRVDTVEATADAAIPTAQKGAANGVATLGADSRIPSAQIPDLSRTYAHVDLLPIRGDRLRFVTVMNAHVISSASQYAGWLDQLLAWNYTTISLDDLHAYLITGDGSALPSKPLVLTFDDGGLSQYQIAFPALVARGMKATFYLVPDWMDDLISSSLFLEPNHFTWANAQEMRAAGMSMQSHGKAHRKFAAEIGAAGAVADWLYSKQRIEQMVPGETVSHLAFPNGDTSDAVTAALAAEPSIKTARTVTNPDGSTSLVTYYADRLRFPCTAGTPQAFDVAQLNILGGIERYPQLAYDFGFNHGVGWTASPAAAVSYDTATKYEGAQSVKIVQQTTDASHTMLHAAPIGFWGGVDGRIRIKTANMPAGACQVRMNLTRTDGTIYQTPTYVTTGGTQDWAEYAWSYRGDHRVYNVQPILFVAGNAAPTGTAWFDLLDLRRQPGRTGAWPLGF